MPVEFPEFNFYHSQVCSLGYQNNLFLFRLQSVSKFTVFGGDFSKKLNNGQSEVIR